MHLVSPQFMDVRLDGEEEVSGAGRWVQAEGVTEVAIEVAPPERGVAAIGESKAALGQPPAQRAQYACFADVRLSQEGTHSARVVSVRSRCLYQRCRKIWRIQRDNSLEVDLPIGSTKPMNKPKFYIKVLRIAAAVLTLVAQVILACMG